MNSQLDEHYLSSLKANVKSIIFNEQEISQEFLQDSIYYFSINFIIYSMILPSIALSSLIKFSLNLISNRAKRMCSNIQQITLIKILLMINIIVMNSIQKIQEILLSTFYFTTELLETKLNQYRMLNTLLTAIDYTLVLYMLLGSQFSQIQIIKDTMITVQNVFNLILSQSGAQEIFFIYQCVSSLLFMTTALLLNLNKEFSKRSYVQFLLFIIFMLFRLIYFNCTAQLYYVWSSPQQFIIIQQGRYVLSTFLLLMLAYNYFVCRNSLFLKQLQPFFVLLWMATQLDYLLSIAILTFASYRLYACKQKNHLIALIIPACIWVILEQSVLNTASIECIQCASYFFFGLAGISSVSTSLTVSDNKELEILKYWKYTELKKQVKISKGDEYLIEQIYLEQFMNNPESELIEIIKPVQDWTKTEHFKLLELQIKHYAKTQSQQAELFLLKVKTKIGKKSLECIKKIRTKYKKYTGMSSLLYRYELYKLLIQWQNTYLKFKDQARLIQNMVAVDNKIRNFYTILNNALTTMQCVWKELGKNLIQFQNIQEKYTQVLQSKSNLLGLYGQISQKYQSNKQEFILNQFLKMLNLKPNLLNNSNTEIEFQTKLDQKPFLLTKDGKIINATFKFLDKFKYRLQELIGTDIVTIFPRILQQSLDFVNQNNINIKLKEENQIILNGEGYITLTRLQKYVFPNFTEGIKYIYFFNTHGDLDKEIIILYNSQSDIIEDASHEFIKILGIDRNVFHSSGYSMTLQQVFTNLHLKNQAVQNALQSNQGVVGRINQKLFKSILQDEKFNIKLVSKFGQRVIFKLQTINPDRISAKSVRATVVAYLNNQFLDIKFDQQQISQNADQQIDKLYEEIKQKKNNLQKTDTITSLGPIKIIFCFFILFLFASVIVIYTQTTQRIGWYRFMITQIININERNDQLAGMLQQSYIVFQMNNWPPPQLNADQINNTLTQAVNSLKQVIYRFQKFYVGGLSNEKLNTHNYQLQFDNYNMSVNTNMTTLMDFVWAATLATRQTSIVDFLVKNFQVIDLLRQETANLDNYYLEFNVYLLNSRIIIYIMITMTVLVRLIEIYYVWNIEIGFRAVEGLYMFLPQNICKQYQTKIYKFIRNFTELNNFKEQQDCPEDESQVSEQSNLLVMKNKFYKTEIRKIKKSSTLIFMSLLRFLVIISFLLFYLTPLLLKQDQQKAEVIEVLQAENQLRLQYYDVKTSILKVFYNLIDQQINNVTHETNYTDSLINTYIKFNHRLPSQFNPFVDNIWLYMNSDLCANISNSDESTFCYGLFNGILAEGMSKSMVNYQIGLHTMNEMNISQIYQDNIYIQNKLTQKYFLKQLRYMTSIYLDCQKNHQDSLSKIYLCFFLVGLALVAIVAGLYYSEYNYLENRIKLCNSLLNLFPEQALSRELSKQYLRDSNLIDKLNAM